MQKLASAGLLGMSPYVTAEAILTVMLALSQRERRGVLFLKSSEPEELADQKADFDGASYKF